MTRERIKKETIISLLKESSGYVSGAKMALQLGVTRAAVWKTMVLLKKDGYVIESSPAKGYLLVESPDLCIADLKKNIAATKKIGHELFFYDSVPSTNMVAMELASQGCPDGTVVISDAQTAGKGRLGRSWSSPPGKNLYMSIVLRPGISPRDATALTLLAAVACASVLRRFASIPVSIKWPNDLIVGHRKMGGILTEIKADLDRINYAIVGIGININLTAEEMPQEIKAIATSIFIETGGHFSRSELAGALILNFDKWYRLLLTKGKKVITNEWLTMSSTIGKRIRVTAMNQTFEGVAEGIDDEGLLIVKLHEGTYRKVSAGDITMVRTNS
jgi:BirA family biotin operon repressor/biotin-[acetyl-CoA-carboxylase] ligase